MHVLYLTSFYPVPERPHHGIFFRDHAEALAQKHKVFVLNIQVPSLKTGKSLRPEIKQFRKNGVLTVHSSQPVLSHRFTSSVEKAQMKALENGLDAVLENHKIDIIIAQCSMPAGWWAREVKLKTGIPFGVIEHFTFLKEDIRKNRQQINKIYDDAEFIGVVYDDYKKMIFNEFNIEVKSVMNVVGKEFDFTPNHSTEKIKWIFVGYEVPKKGPDILTQSWKEYQKNQPEDKLTIVGSGAFSELREMESVNIIESADRNEMVHLMSKHHALISTSRKETFGMAVAEMLASGRPVMVTPSGGPEQFVTQNNGLISPSFEPAEVAKTMTKLRNSYSSYNGRQIREDILKKFGAEAYISRIESLLSNHV